MPGWLPSVVSLGCTLTALAEGCASHVHDCDELCLVANDATIIRHAGVEREAAPGTAFLFRRGEAHGFRNGRRQEPHLWLVHYRADEALDRDCPRLADRDPGRRVWRLSPDQLAAYRGLFCRLQAETMDRRAGADAAASAWLRLLLIAAARWGDGAAVTPAHPTADAELLGLWEAINDHVERPGDLAGALARRVRNYDSLRHRFTKAFTRSPRAVLMELRLQRAKHLLLETDLPIAAIAERLGYARQQEFARAFTRAAGCAPSAWRKRPT